MQQWKGLCQSAFTNSIFFTPVSSTEPSIHPKIIYWWSKIEPNPKCGIGFLACGNLPLLVPALSTGVFKSQKSFQVALVAVLKIFWEKLGIAMHWIQTAHCQSGLLKSCLLTVKDKLNELLLPVWIFSTCHWNQHRIPEKKCTTRFGVRGIKLHFSSLVLAYTCALGP